MAISIGSNLLPTPVFSPTKQLTLAARITDELDRNKAYQLFSQYHNIMGALLPPTELGWRSLGSYKS